MPYQAPPTPYIDPAEAWYSDPDVQKSRTKAYTPGADLAKSAAGAGQNVIPTFSMLEDATLLRNILEASGAPALLNMQGTPGEQYIQAKGRMENFFQNHFGRMPHPDAYVNMYRAPR